jgi:pilus assembly protein Flp/PilA
MLPYVLAWLSQFDREDEGQGMVEYALILVLVSVVAIVILGTVGDNVVAVFTRISEGLAITG